MSLSQLLFSFSGRINRQPYWLATLAIVAAVLVLFVVIFLAAGGIAIMEKGFGALGGLLILIVLLYIPLLWIGIALGVKRLHDRNKSGWWLVLFWLVPSILQGIGDQIAGLGIVLSLAGLAISIWGLVEIGFLRGTAGANQYGPDPLAGQA